MICVTHELQFARQVADRIVMMEDGTIIEQGPPAELFADAHSPRTRAFLAKLAYTPGTR